MFYQIFLSPQVKQCAIVTYKHGVHELPDKFTKIKVLLILVKTLQKQKLSFSRSALIHAETRVSLRYLVNYCRLQNQHHLRQPSTQPCIITARARTTPPKNRIVNSFLWHTKRMVPSVSSKKTKKSKVSNQ